MALIHSLIEAKTLVYAHHLLDDLLGRLHMFQWFRHPCGLLVMTRLHMLTMVVLKHMYHVELQIMWCDYITECLVLF